MDCIPQDEYFEWEDIMDHQSIESRMSMLAHTTPPTQPSEYRPSYLDTHASIKIQDFAWAGCMEDVDDDVSKTSALSWETIPSSDSKNTNTSITLSAPESEDDTSSEDSDNSYTSQTTPLVSEVRDDISMYLHPHRNVDFLSHNWEESDIWSSRRFIRSTMQEHPNFARWENACWRSSAKIRLGLAAVSPLSFNWMRDQDDTWLYGPFCGQMNDNDVTKKLTGVKSILKRPCVQEVLLRGSITTGLVTSLQRRRTDSHLRGRESRQPVRARFADEVEQYRAIETTPAVSLLPEEEEGVWMAEHSRPAAKKVVRKLPSTTLRSSSSSNAPVEPEDAPKLTLPAFDDSYKSGSSLSEWMWLSGEDADGDDLDWISAAADRTSAALRAATQSDSSKRDTSPSSTTSSSSSFQDEDKSSVNSSSASDSAISSQDGDELDLEKQYLLACDEVADCLAPCSDIRDNSLDSDDEDEQPFLNAEYNGRNKSSVFLERKVGGKMGITMDEERRTMYEQMMEEFNLILE